MGSRHQRHCQFELKETEKVEWNEGNQLDFTEILNHRFIWLYIYTVLQEKGIMTLKVIQRLSGLGGKDVSSLV